MIKLIKLIYVNLLGLFNFNEMIIAKNAGIKSNIQNKNVIYFLSCLLLGYILYMLLTTLNIVDKYNILLIGYILSFIICLMSDFVVVGNTIFKSDDNELLLSLPVDKRYIIFSKLFNVYIKNLLYVVVIMLSATLAFAKFMKVSETLGLVLFLNSILIPFIPIVISSVIVYFDTLFNVKHGKVYKFIKYFLGLFIIVFLYFVIELIGFDFIVKNILFIFPMNYLFYESIVNYNIICCVSLVTISILVVYLYSLCMNSNYLNIISSLKGVPKKSKFKYKKRLRLGKCLGLVRKEFLGLVNNKKYFTNSFGLSIIVTFMLLLITFFGPTLNLNGYDQVIKIWSPNLLAMVAAFGNSTIYSVSLEKEARYLTGTMPIGLFKFLFSKWFINVLIGGIFVLFNGTLVVYLFKLNGFRLAIVYLLPFVALMFNSLLGLFLDSFYLVKNCYDDNLIMKQRVVTFVPVIVSLLIGFLPMFTSNLTNYFYVQGAYTLAMFIMFLIILIIMIIRRKKISQKIFY